MVNGLLLSEHRWKACCLLGSEIVYCLSATCWLTFMPGSFLSLWAVRSSRTHSCTSTEIPFSNRTSILAYIKCPCTKFMLVFKFLSFIHPGTSCILSVQERVPRQYFWFFVLSILLTFWVFIHTLYCTACCLSHLFLPCLPDPATY